MTDAPFAPAAAAEKLPVARVLPLLGLPQLDRPFDYLVPRALAEEAVVGCRVRIRFHGQLVNALVLERCATPTHDGKLSYLKDVISSEVVYPPQLRRLVDSLAEYYGATRSNIIRSAIPTRHARAERARKENTPPTWEELGKLAIEDPDLSAWGNYVFGESFVNSVRKGAPARAAWQPVPGEQVATMLAALSVSVARDGGGVLIIVPDARTQARFESAFRELISARQLTLLGAGLGPESRYRRYLDILHGQGRIVVGTRSAAYAPVKNLRLAVIVDDGDDNLVDPRAPYVHSREVLVTRSAQEGCALIFASYSRTAEVQLLVSSGWAHNLVAGTDALTESMPEMIASTDTSEDPDDVSRGRLPAIAFRRAKAALREELPILVQVPRKGYVPTLSCRSCGAPARCRWCNGPLGIPPSDNPDDPAPPTCRWCGRIDIHHRCHSCGSTKIRPVVVGSERTAEEFGRIFSPFPVIASSGERIVDDIPEGPRVVVATPGAEPYAPEGYGAVMLLDTWAMLGRQDLRAHEEAYAHWSRAVTLARPREQGGAVVIDADAAVPTVADLLAWDAVGAANRELADRTAAALPPAFHVAAVDGTEKGLRNFLESLEVPSGAEILGPVDLPRNARPPAGVEPGTPIQRMLVRCDRRQARAVGAALKAAQVVRATRKDPTPVRVVVDPINFG